MDEEEGIVVGAPGKREESEERAGCVPEFVEGSGDVNADEDRKKDDGREPEEAFGALVERRSQQSFNHC